MVHVLVGDIEAGRLRPPQHDRHRLVVRQHDFGRRSPVEPDLLTGCGQDPFVLEMLDLGPDQRADLVVGQPGLRLRWQVVGDMAHGLFQVEDRRRRLVAESERLAPHRDRGDGEHGNGGEHGEQPDHPGKLTSRGLRQCEDVVP